MSKVTLKSVLGGDILVKKGGLIKQWKFILYIFSLVIIYISIHFGVRSTLQDISRNEEHIRNMRSEYMGKYSEMLSISKRGEIEKLLEEKNLALVPPEVPPTIIKMED